jgi:hypothetical protein
LRIIYFFLPLRTCLAASSARCGLAGRQYEILVMTSLLSLIMSSSSSFKYRNCSWKTTSSTHVASIVAWPPQRTRSSYHPRARRPLITSVGWGYTRLCFVEGHRPLMGGGELGTTIWLEEADVEDRVKVGASGQVQLVGDISHSLHNLEQPVETRP